MSPTQILFCLAIAVSFCSAQIPVGQYCPNVACNDTSTLYGDFTMCYNNVATFAGAGAACNASRPCWPYFACRAGVCSLKGPQTILGCACDNNTNTCGDAQVFGLICQAGVCAEPPPGPLGTSCRSDRQCLSNLCYNGQCSTLRQVNQTCNQDSECVNGLYCDAYSRLCQQRIALNGSCAYSDACISRFCNYDPEFGTPVCQPQRTRGQSCFQYNECVSPLVCNLGFCGDPVADGQNVTCYDGENLCIRKHSSCISWSVDGYCDACQCTPAYADANGVRCLRDEDCSSGVCGCTIGNETNCYERRCEAALSGTAGVVCEQDKECAVGFYCNRSRVCRALGSTPVGDECNNDFECVNGALCPNSVCEAQGACTSSMDCARNSLCQCTNTVTKTYGCVYNASVTNVFSNNYRSDSCWLQTMLPFQKAYYSDYLQCERTGNYSMLPTCMNAYAQFQCCSVCPVAPELRVFETAERVDCLTYTLSPLPPSCGSGSPDPMLNCDNRGPTGVPTTRAPATTRPAATTAPAPVLITADVHCGSMTCTGGNKTVPLTITSAGIRDCVALTDPCDSSSRPTNMSFVALSPTVVAQYIYGGACGGQIVQTLNITCGQCAVLPSSLYNFLSFNPTCGAVPTTTPTVSAAASVPLSLAALFVMLFVALLF